MFTASNTKLSMLPDVVNCKLAALLLPATPRRHVNIGPVLEFAGSGVSGGSVAELRGFSASSSSHKKLASG
jgi:hypothetical protein